MLTLADVSEWPLQSNFRDCIWAELSEHFPAHNLKAWIHSLVAPPDVFRFPSHSPFFLFQLICWKWLNWPICLTLPQSVLSCELNNKFPQQKEKHECKLQAWFWLPFQRARESEKVLRKKWCSGTSLVFSLPMVPGKQQVTFRRMHFGSVVAFQN